LATSLLTVSSAFAQEHNFEDISQKIKNVSQGLAGQEAFDAVVAQATDLIAQLHVPGLAVGVIHGTKAESRATGCALILYVLANCLRGERRAGRLPHRGASAKCF
jgi:hypothetical protein